MHGVDHETLPGDDDSVRPGRNHGDRRRLRGAWRRPQRSSRQLRARSEEKPSAVVQGQTASQQGAQAGRLPGTARRGRHKQATRHEPTSPAAQCEWPQPQRRVPQPACPHRRWARPEGPGTDANGVGPAGQRAWHTVGGRHREPGTVHASAAIGRRARVRRRAQATGQFRASQHALQLTNRPQATIDRRYSASHKRPAASGQPWSLGPGWQAARLARQSAPQGDRRAQSADAERAFAVHSAIPWAAAPRPDGRGALVRQPVITPDRCDVATILRTGPGSGAFPWRSGRRRADERERHR